MAEILILLLALAVGYFSGARMSRKRHYRECSYIVGQLEAAYAPDPNYLSLGGIPRKIRSRALNDAAAAIREAANG